MKYLNILYFGAFLFVVAFAIGAVLSAWGDEQTAIRLNPAHHVIELGEIPAVKGYRLLLEVVNPSAAAISKVEVASSCYCTQVITAPMRLGPREKQSVELMIDLNSAIAASQQKQNSEFEVDLTINCMRDQGHEVWITPVTLKAKPVQLLSVTGMPSQWRLDTDQVDRALSIQCHVAASVKELSAKCDEQFASVSLKNLNAQDYRILCDLNPELPAGNYDFVIEMSGFLSDAKEQSHLVDIPVSVSLIGDIIVQPDSLQFVSSPLESSFSKSILLQSRTGTPFKIENVRAPAFLSVDLVEPENDESYEYEYQIKVVEGSRSETGHIELDVLEASGKRVVVSVPVRCMLTGGVE